MASREAAPGEGGPRPGLQRAVLAMTASRWAQADAQQSSSFPGVAGQNGALDDGAVSKRLVGQDLVLAAALVQSRLPA